MSMSLQLQVTKVINRGTVIIKVSFSVWTTMWTVLWALLWERYCIDYYVVGPLGTTMRKVLHGQYFGHYYENATAWATLWWALSATH